MKAYDSAMRRFIRQKSDDPVYICRATVARKEFWTVLSTAELKANKISPKSCWTTVDGRYGLSELKQSRQRDAQTRLMATAVRSYQRFRKTREKLDKMERDAKASKRPLELDTTNA